MKTDFISSNASVATETTSLFLNPTSPRRGTQCGDGFIAGPMLMHRLAVHLRLSPRDIDARIAALRSLVEGSPDGQYRERLRLRGHFVSDHQLAALLEEIHLVAPPVAGVFRKPTRSLQSPLSSTAPASRDDGRLQLVVITGDLGSGKTTLLNRLLGVPGMQSSLVFVNELGEEPVDQLFVRDATSVRDVELLGGGCLCCKLGDDLVGALRSAVDRRTVRPDFDRILVETSGEADPLEIVQSIARDRQLREALQVAGVITTVDMLSFCDHAFRSSVPVRQLAAARWIVPTKGDLLDPEQYAAGLQSLAALAPWAQVVLDDAARAIAQQLADPEMPTAAVDEVDAGAAMQRFLQMHRAESARHDPATNAVTLHCGRLPIAALRLFCEALMLAKGDELFRMKGEVEVGDSRHLVLQGVRTSLHEIRESVDSQPGTRLTIIGRRIDAAGLRRLIALCGAVAAPAQGSVERESECAPI